MSPNNFIKIIECPRDAMQGIERIIPTHEKIKYINQLSKVGFDTIDMGSFVSPKAIPQMADTAQVLENLDVDATISKLLVIVANPRGAKDASRFERVSFLGYPLSISETFQKRNTNRSIAEALNDLEEIKNICQTSGKKLVTYISMGFGNPYNDPYEPQMVTQFAGILATLGSDIVSIADTIGSADASLIETMFIQVAKDLPDHEIGVHIHSDPSSAASKIAAAYRGGCRRIDGAIKGFGGCPMAKDELVGNIATETILAFARENQVETGIDDAKFNQSLLIADEIFRQ